MGIGSGFIDLLIWLQESRYVKERASVMEIGAQQLANSFLAASDRIAHLGRLFGIDRPVALPQPKPSYIVHGELEHLQPTAPFARDFWQWLEFTHSAIDIDGSPGSIPLDLNYDSVPSDARAKYDLVTNFGTTEHVANQLNAFKVIHDLTRVGGIMVHEIPAQGMFNHGLINYNPKFFWMLARSNQYKWLHMDFSIGGVHALHQDIINNVFHFVPEFPARSRDYSAADCGLTVVMQKEIEMAYVAPLDVNTGTTTDNESLKQRYWTVFKSET